MLDRWGRALDISRQRRISLQQAGRGGRKRGCWRAKRSVPTSAAKPAESARFREPKRGGDLGEGHSWIAEKTACDLEADLVRKAAKCRSFGPEATAQGAAVDHALLGKVADRAFPSQQLRPEQVPQDFGEIVRFGLDDIGRGHPRTDVAISRRGVIAPVARPPDPWPPPAFRRRAELDDSEDPISPLDRAGQRLDSWGRPYRLFGYSTRGAAALRAIPSGSFQTIAETHA